MARPPKETTSSKVETLTIRLTPKMRWGLDLLSRKQHRSLTSVAEWAIDLAFKIPNEGLVVTSEDQANVDILDKTWDPSPARRFLKLAFYSPNLMTYEEEVLWGLVRRTAYFWRGNWTEEEGGRTYYFTPWDILPERVEENWETLNHIVRGESTEYILPRITKENAKPPFPEDYKVSQI